MAVDALARALAAGKVPVTAYEMAVKAGYTGTEEQFAQDMGNSGTNAANAAASASAAAASAEFVSASAAQIATNTSDISDLKESLNDTNISVDDVSEKINLYDKATATTGEVISTSDGITTSASQDGFHSDYIDVQYGNDYYIKADSSQTIRIFTYSGSGTFIKTYTLAVNTHLTLIVFEENVARIRIQGSMAVYNANVRLRIGNYPDEYQVSESETESDNLFIKADATVDEVISTSDGITTSPSADGFYSDYITVDPEKDYTVKADSSVTIRIFTYNSDGTFIETYTKSIGTTASELIIGSSVGKIRIQGSKAAAYNAGIDIRTTETAPTFRAANLNAIDRIARYKTAKNEETIKDYGERIGIVEKIIGGQNASNMNVDVCIVGGGAAGVACAYALRYSGLSVCLVEAQPYLGGTHTQAWVNSLLPTPSPKFFESVVYEQVEKGQAAFGKGEHTPLTEEEQAAMVWTDTFLRKNHRADQKDGINILINPKAMALKYYSDLNPYIRILLNTKIVSATASDRKITSVTTNSGMTITANQFIDCSATDILLSLTGVQLIAGEDSKTRYQADYGFTEAHAPSANSDLVSAPTLIYKVTKGDEDLSALPSTISGFVAYTQYDPNKDIYINNFAAIDQDGGNLVSDGIKETYNKFAPKEIYQWAYAKTHTSALSQYKFSDVAPMLGVRELYRCFTERILNENSLYIKITNNIATQASNLDKIVAVGNHHIDIWGSRSITPSAIDENLVPYGVPYGVMIPLEYDNVLVASKGAGMTHIAQSTFRLTKDMMQLGWAAGYATILYNENDLDDYRNVDVATMQSAAYADIVGMVSKVVALLS